MSTRAAGSGRLSRSAEFERVYRHGRSTANRHLVLYTFANPAAQRARLGMSVSRKVGGAVERNRLKRLLREAFAAQSQQLGEGHDVVLVARPALAELARRDGLGGVESSLAELIAKAGLSAGPGPPSASTSRVRSSRGQTSTPGFTSTPGSTPGAQGRG